MVIRIETGWEKFEVWYREIEKLERWKMLKEQGLGGGKPLYSTYIVELLMCWMEWCCYNSWLVSTEKLVWMALHPQLNFWIPDAEAIQSIYSLYSNSKSIKVNFDISSKELF